MRVPEVLAIPLPEKILVAENGQPLDPEIQKAIRDVLPRLRHWLPRLLDEAVFDNIADLAAQKLARYESSHEVHNRPGLAWKILRDTASSWLRTVDGRMEGSYISLAPDDNLPSRHENAEDIERQALLSELLARMSPRERAVYLFHTWGFSHRDVASEFGISEANVATILSRAKRKLAQLLNTARARDRAPKRDD